MSSVDWAAHTPHEVRVALETAPKVAGPWRQHGAGWHRLTSKQIGPDVGGGVVLQRTNVVCFVWPRTETTPHVVRIYLPELSAEIECADVEDGKRLADAQLRAAGWLLDDEEEAP